MNTDNHPLHILVIEDKKYRQTISLEKKIYSLGRHPNNSILICDQKASRYHATLMRRQKDYNGHYSYWIVDGDMQGNKSLNGIYVNGEKCLAKELKNGDLINFGCQVNATYHALTDWSNTIVDIDKIKFDPFSKQSLDLEAAHTPTLTAMSSIQNNHILGEILPNHLNSYQSNASNTEETILPENYHDPLTKLPNQFLFSERLSLALKNAQQNNSLMAVALLTINHFDHIYEDFGCPIAEQLLQEIAQTLNSSIRYDDLVARLGKNEFGFIFPKIRYAQDREIICEKLLNAVAQSLTLSGNQLQLSANIGIALYPHDGLNTETLLQQAKVILLNDYKQDQDVHKNPAFLTC